MRRLFHHSSFLVALLTVLLLGAVCCPPARSAEGLIEHAGSVFDDIVRGLDYLGSKAQDLVGPGLGFGDGDGGGFLAHNEFDERYPVSPNATVTITNQFGEIRVQTWEDSVVRITAKISVRAESKEVSEETLRNVDIRVTPIDGRLDVRTVLNTSPGSGKPAIAVNYEVTLPRDANLVASNYFGDTVITGVGGTVSVDAGYGTVDLRDIGGAVDVRARGGGEFALLAHGLRKGGTFELHRAKAVFGNVAGPLKVDNFRGSVELADLPAEADVDVVCESGPITLRLAENAAPGLMATALFGDVKSDIPLNFVSQGTVTVARSTPEDTKRRIALRASFADIAVFRQSAGTGAPLPVEPAGLPYKDATTLPPVRVPEGGELRIEAVTGDVTVKGVDDDEVRVTATKLVRTADQANVRTAQQALDVKLTPSEKGLALSTSATGDLAALGCSYHRIDLVIECPRTLAVHVTAQDGHTEISGVGAGVTVLQKSGPVSVDSIKGDVHVETAKGEIRAAGCSGTTEVSTGAGGIRMSDIFGPIKAQGAQGRILIESPHAGIFARNQGDDIRVLSLDALNGDYDLAVEKGNISILIPAATDANLSAAAEFGAVLSSIPMPGSLRKDVQEFSRPGAGASHVTLRTKNGNIVIN